LVVLECQWTSFYVYRAQLDGLIGRNWTDVKDAIGRDCGVQLDGVVGRNWTGFWGATGRLTIVQLDDMKGSK